MAGRFAGVPVPPSRQAEVGAAVMLGAVLLPVRPLLAVAAGAVAGAAPAVRRSRRARSEREAVAGELACWVGLLRVALEAGLGARSAFDAAAGWVGGPLGDELGALGSRCRRGRPFSAELELLARRWAGEVAPVCRVLLAAERDGAPLLGSLARVEDDVRHLERRRLEERLARLPVRLLAPLTVAVLPGFVLLAVVPLLAGSVLRLLAG